MGWFTAHSTENDRLPPELRTVIGDPPLDILDKALEDIVMEYVYALNRRPTMAEMAELFTCELRAFEYILKHRKAPKRPSGGIVKPIRNAKSKANVKSVKKVSDKGGAKKSNTKKRSVKPGADLVLVVDKKRK